MMHIEEKACRVGIQPPAMFNYGAIRLAGQDSLVVLRYPKQCMQYTYDDDDEQGAQNRT
jgi:hypothetical protein